MIPLPEGASGDTVHFGILVSVAILGGLLGNLTTLPLLLRLIDR